MNLYVFFCLTIKSVGGAQLYIRKKTEYLQERGWGVKYVYPLDGVLHIKELNSIENIRIEEIHLKAQYYSYVNRRNIIDKISSFIGGTYDKIIIESHSPSLTSWAELVSKNVGARHLVYNINEKVKCPNSYFDYYSFKCGRRELKGISKESIPYFFSDYTHSLDVEDTCLHAYGASDCIHDVSFNIPYTSDNYTIGVVGRLEKEFAKDTLDEIGVFLNKYKNKLFNIIYVGGELSGHNDIKERIQKYYRENHTNVNVFFTGYIFPIPVCLVKSFNVCISGAGASREVSRCNVPTITIDPRTMIPNGVLWVDTNATIYSDGRNINKESLSHYLEQVYNSPQKYRPDPPMKQGSFEEHLNILDKCPKDLEYHTKCFEQNTISYFLKRVSTFILPTSSLLKIGGFLKRFI